ncbi:MAG TPA: HAD hydrolase-like protein [Thermoguttaceae bacterium]|nr:HAD hydrolase-like protein [Thermoguttaceae bacterium]
MPTRPPDSARPSAARTKLLLFDVDGTLLLSGGGSLRAMTTAARRWFGPTFSLEEVDRNGRLDPHIIGAALELNGVRATDEQLESFRESYLQELRTEVGSSRILPGVGELLAELRAAEGVLLGLVTGNYAEAARIKLEGVRIDPAWFVVGGFGEQAATRSRLVGLAIETAASLVGRPIPGRDVIVIGDTPRDVESADDAGCRSLAVATGNYPPNVLEAAGADVVLPDLTNPAPLWAMLEDRDAG